LSSCQAELPNQQFYVKAVDQDGNVLVDNTIATLRNGFFELWLPRNRRIALRVQGLNRTAKGLITTFDNSDTCITTFRLQ
jgi:hypothetical protein